MSSSALVAEPITPQKMMASPAIASGNPEMLKGRPFVLSSESQAELLSSSRTTFYLNLPNQMRNLSRLSIQHHCIVVALKGLYPAEAKPFVHAALANDGPKGKRKILDVGSGNGAWTMDMAREFPHATVIGIDLDPAKPDNLPPNCSFAFGDFTDWNNIDAIKNQKFDVIHSRFTRSSVRDVSKEYDDIIRSLVPGGVLLAGDGDTHLMIKRNGEYPILPAAMLGDPISLRDNIGPDLVPTSSWFARFMYDFIGNATRERGFPFFAPEAFIPLLLENARKSKECAERGAYEWGNIERKQYYMPIGWDGDEEDVKLGLGPDVGEAMRETALLFLRMWRDISIPGFLATGVTERTVDEWVSRAVEEINDPSFRIYMYLDYSWAVKVAL